MEVDAHRSDRPVTAESSGRGGVLTTAIALALPVLAALALWVWQSDAADEAGSSRADDAAAVRAATERVLVWASVDYREVDQYVDDVRAGSTGAFLTQFDESEEPLRQLLRQNRSVQVPVVPDDGAGLLERDGDEATVLVALDATVTNKATKTPQPREYRLQVTVQKVNGTWLMSGLEFIDEQA